ncbi:hypothetical protein PPERSA_04157 [Pseudocohnilembus persalinus]|uniref:C2H2-type domain-containing protein n=1 Tax=Pseudocohnilembus persalinus TaxID=266149 RepID=A0A0V0QNS2_PSEPJ|nr:hypothetical protein PPERSA_04157 [Pseudocohnilembus persalinus]|eukprot:KRX03605.1 hypothetical protein PPERSA_04157 [Pseudocohnilembus persalinus]
MDNQNFMYPLNQQVLSQEMSKFTEQAKELEVRTSNSNQDLSTNSCNIEQPNNLNTYEPQKYKENLTNNKILYINKNNSDIQNGQNRENTCPFCNKSYKHKYIMNVHMRKQHRLNSHKCQQCDESFVSVKDLKIHIEIIHLGVSDYEVEQFNY